MIRTGEWIGIAILLSFFSAPNFLVLLNETLDYTFGNIFPAIPFVALLLVLFCVRRNDLLRILNEDVGFGTGKQARLLGLGIAIALIFFIRPFTYDSVYVSAGAIALALYTAMLIVNPLTKRFIFPYAVLFVVGIAAPALITWAFGEPLAFFSAYLSARIISLSGIPAIWHGTQFALFSKTGEYLTATVTPGCSSITSITTFLGLLGLVHLDLKKKLSLTLKVALMGIVALFMLNGIRILILIWVGYSIGIEEFWSLHNWVGYILFFAFYLVVISVYSRSGGIARGNILRNTRGLLRASGQWKM